MTYKTCQFPAISNWDPCERKPSVLSTDVDPRDQLRYVPVCKVHLRVAITDGLIRCRKTHRTERIPTMILPLPEVA